MSKIKNQNYFVVHGWMLNELGLKGNELLIFSLIYGFSQDNETRFRGSLSYMVDFTGASRSTVVTSLSSLVEKGFLLKFSEQKNGVTFNEYSAIPPVQFSAHPGTILTPPPGTETEPNNNTLDSKEGKKGSSKPFVEPSEEEVIAYFEQNGYSKEAGSKAFKYYQAGEWKDSEGKPVRSWKQKMQGVWFKDENKAKGPLEIGLFQQPQATPLPMANAAKLAKYD